MRPALTLSRDSGRRVRFSIPVLAAVIASLACVSLSDAVPRGELRQQAIAVGDRSREYLLYLPAGHEDRTKHRPLVLVFHGGGGTAKGIAREVGRSLHGIADTEGIYVAYPQAIDKMWDFGAGEVSEALEARIDDRSFFAALLDELTGTLPIDERRVFATGISRGGQASYFVACSFPERIRAIAPVAMPMPVFMLELCRDSPGAAGVAILNGTKDPLVPYDGGPITVGRRQRGEVMSTDATVEFWRATNGCAKQPTQRSVINSARDRMQVERTLWDQCEYAPVLLYRIEGGGHTWPSGRQYLPRFVVGRVNRDIDGASEVWSFFQRFH